MSHRNLSDAALRPLAPGEYASVMAKSQGNRLAFATWLLFFRDQGRFPRDASDFELVDIPALARQIEMTAPAEGAFPVAERTAKRLRSEIRARYGFREATVADAEALTEWLRDHAAPEAGASSPRWSNDWKLDAVNWPSNHRPRNVRSASNGRRFVRIGVAFILLFTIDRRR
jgi:hypothetical protein